MQKPTLRCALLAGLISKHHWGSPIPRDDLIRLAAIDKQDYPKARDVYDDLRSKPYINDYGPRGIELDNSNFDQVADILYHECRWEVWEIDSRLKHYEGIDDHDWA